MVVVRAYVLCYSGWVRQGLAQWMAFLSEDDRYDVPVSFVRDRPIASARCRIAKDLLDRGGDYCLMVDADQEFSVDPLDFVEDDRDILGFPSPIYKGTARPHPIRWNVWQTSRDSLTLSGLPRLHRVAAMGTGCVLIARRVFEHPDMRAPFRDDYDEDGIRRRGEDLAFCERARACGFSVWVAAHAPLEHYKELPLGALMGAIERPENDDPIETDTDAL